jgi:hypothetical protein
MTGFNWKIAAFYLGLTTLGGFIWWAMGLSRAEAQLMDVFTSLGFIALFLYVSPVARHNIRQVFRRNGHQWVGNGPHCEECNEPSPTD